MQIYHIIGHTPNIMPQEWHVVINDNYKASHKWFATAKQAWKHAEKLASSYASKYKLTAVYTTHPRGPFACWIVK